MYKLDTFFRCREIILNTNIEIMDGFKGVLNELDEYLIYYDKYISDEDYLINDYLMTIIEDNIDHKDSFDLRDTEFYLTDNIIKMSEDGNYVLFYSGEGQSEWLSLSEFDELLDEHIKKRIERLANSVGKVAVDEIEHKEKKEFTLDELLQYFDEIESDNTLKVFLEEKEENKNDISKVENSGNLVDDIMGTLGLI